MLNAIKSEKLATYMPLLVLIVLCICFALIEPRFASVRNMSSILRNASPGLMVAIGVSFIIIMGSIDLSMEGTVSVTAVIFAFLFLALGGSLASVSAWLAFPAVLLVGAVIGLINGLVHVKLKIPSFMSSLAMGFVGTGFAMFLTGGDRIRVEDPIFRSLLTVRFLEFPLMVYLAGIALLVAVFIQKKMIIGRNFYAVGGGEDLAKASGLNVERVRVMGFMIAGVFYALAAVLAIARIGIAETVTGANYMFISITSVVVGGTALWGGIGGIWNTLIGVLTVAVISNGMLVVGLPDYLQSGMLGILVIVAIVLSTNRRSVSFVK